MNTQIKKKNPYGVISITLGIISIITAFFWFIAFPTAILAIIFGNKGRKMYSSSTSLAGMILGIVGISISGLILLFFIFIFVGNLLF